MVIQVSRAGKEQGSVFHNMKEIPTTRLDNKGVKGNCFYMVDDEVNGGR